MLKHSNTNLPVLHGLRECERAVVASHRHPLNQFSTVHAAGLRCDVQHASDFVKGLADRVVERIAQQFIVANALSRTRDSIVNNWMMKAVAYHIDRHAYLCENEAAVASGHEQHDERELGASNAFLRQSRDQHVCLTTLIAKVK